MKYSRIKPVGISAILSIAVASFTAPQIAFAAGGSNSGGSHSGGSHEPSHPEVPHASEPTSSPSVSPSATPEPSHQEDNHHSVPDSSATPGAQPSATPESISSGSNEREQVVDSSTGAIFKLERKQKTKRSVVLEDKLTGSLKLTVPTLSVGVSTNDEAISADAVVTLSRQGAAYAECSLDFSILKKSKSGTKAEYKVDIEKKLKKGVVTTRVKKGACDTDLSTDGVQSDLPNVQNGDTYVVQVNDITLVSGGL